MENIPLISIIIPVYNAEKWLHECMRSLINQTLRDIEVICVLDAPTDSSSIIIKTYANADSRIRVIENTRNLHIAESRNLGIKIAKGKYIGFSDDDDVRVLDMYENLYAVAVKQDADVVFGDAIVNNEDKKQYISYQNPTKEAIIKSLLLPTCSVENENVLSKSVWASIYKKDFLQQHNISFLDRRLYKEEDTLFNLRCFLLTENIAYCPNYPYEWNKTHISTSQKDDFAIKPVVNYLYEMKMCLEEAGELSHYSDVFSKAIAFYIGESYFYKTFIKGEKEEKVKMNLIMRSIHFLPFQSFEHVRNIGKRRIRIFSVWFCSLFLFGL